MRNSPPTGPSAILLTAFAALFFISSAWGNEIDPILKESAERGVADAQYEVGARYELGVGAAKDPKVALGWYLKAAQQGNAEAQVRLGIMNQIGRGTPQNIKAAISWYRKAAEQGNSGAQWRLGYIYKEGVGVQDYAQAIIWLRKAAERNSAEAQSQLGEMYARGLGVAQNLPQGVSWIRKGAEHGDQVGQYILGAMYAEGAGVPQDYKLAVSWWKKAAVKGHAQAQSALGTMYFNGYGVTKNMKEAASWFGKAAQQGDADAELYFGQMYADGDGVAKDDALALYWIRKAAEQGKPEAQLHLAIKYHEGRGTSKDEKAAINWYRKAAEQGNAVGQFSLGVVYDSGWENIAADPKLAAQWYRKAAEQGIAKAQSRLGELYFEGLGVAPDIKEAIFWTRKSAEQGEAKPQFFLGVFYEFGIGLATDSREALRWYKKAAAQGFVPEGRIPSNLWSTALPNHLSPNKPMVLASTTQVSREEVIAIIKAAAREALESKKAPPKMIQSDVDNPKYSVPENPNNFAVIIGIEKYSSLAAADFAERDADAVRAHLTAMGYPSRNIYFLGGQQATRAKIAQSLNTWLPKRVNKDSTVFFYFSGHGAPDIQTTQAYLVPVDGDAEDLESTAYPIKLLYEKLGKLKTRQVIVALDTCFSGAGGRSVLAKGTRPLVSKIDQGEIPDNVIALTASDKSEISGTIEDQGHGAFTYYMLKGLAGAAKKDSGAVTVQSLYDYLKPKVQDAARLRNRDQTPQLLPAGGDRAGTILR